MKLGPLALATLPPDQLVATARLAEDEGYAAVDLVATPGGCAREVARQFAREVVPRL